MITEELRNLALTACILVVCFRNVRFTATAIAGQTSGTVSHDAIQRALSRQGAEWSRKVWKKVKRSILPKIQNGYFIIDDTVICKEDTSWNTEMTSKLWCSSEKRYRYGQNVVLLIWTDGKTRHPIDLRFWVKGGGKTKLTLALDMLRVAKQRCGVGNRPKAVLFDSWYAAAELLLGIRSLGWDWICKIKRNRTLDGDIQVQHRWKTTYASCLTILNGGIKAQVIKDKDHFFATSLLHWKPDAIKKAYRKRWWIEEVIKVLKSELGFQTCQARSIDPIRAHAFICLMCFNELEKERCRRKKSTIGQVRSTLFNQPIPLNRASILNENVLA